MIHALIHNGELLWHSTKRVVTTSRNGKRQPGATQSHLNKAGVTQIVNIWTIVLRIKEKGKLTVFHCSDESYISQIKLEMMYHSGNSHQ